MKALVPARAIKGIDQTQMGQPYGAVQYVPLTHFVDQPARGVSPDVSLNIITVYQCVRILAETFASLPLMVYRRLPNGGKERAVDHPLYTVLHDRPNPQMTSFVWRELMMSHLATWGNAYNEITEDRSGRMQLWPIRPDRIEAKYDANGNKVYDYLSPAGGRKRLAPGTIFHVAGLSSNGLAGLSPITLMRSAIGLYKTAETFGESFFRNGARPATVLSHPKTLSDPAVKRLAGQMDELRGSGNAGKTVILEEGLTVTEVGVPPEDAQYMQTRIFEKREIAAGFRIPPHKVGDLERATFSNIEQQALEFIQDTMMPWFVRAEQEMEVQLLDDADYFVEFLVDGYLRGDVKTRAEVYAIRVEHGTLSADEWRASENENPIEGGLGQRYYMPVNYAAVVPAGQEAVAPATVRETITQPLAPGADAAAPLAQAERPQLTVIKSMSQFDCPDCGKLVNRLAAPGTIGYCKGCKAEKTFGETAPPDPLKSMSDFATVALASQSRSTDRIAEAIGGLAAAETGRAIYVNPPQITVPPPDLTDVTTAIEGMAERFDAMSRRLDDAETPKRRDVLRDDAGRIIGLTEWREAV